MEQLKRSYKVSILILIAISIGFLANFVENHILHTILVAVISFIGLVVAGLLYTSIEKGIDQLNKSTN
ncbi:hypothetical protein CN692_21915 [Bacillus sp. AFS002410]|uniref:hypothetical protein n=1 Tax=Bacillus sp. AFS002410 TaxID=2033481 RepID=UPI000BF01328|nr:hypothetical protein [Bacillus sp. AFS002410]PEJ52372.1 hypothetical protein CN692_21915 [Bacillus sp. AFS002410]